METSYIKHYSQSLGRDMECKIYGHAGRPVLFIPCQDGRYFDFENFHMTDVWAPWIESGEVMVFACDSIDNEAWAALGADKRWRIENHECWYNYVVEEMVPTIYHMSGRQDVLTFGCSMGAMHAVNLFCRRPDLFEGVFAISGLYDAPEFFGDYMDDILYNNCPVNYLANMPQDHHYLDMYNNRKILIVVGQGKWEGPLIESTRRLESVLRSKGINLYVLCHWLVLEVNI